jgi:putative DNA primase/helicase
MSAQLERVTQLLDAASSGPRAIVTKASDITPRPLDPVWDGFLFAGKPTLLAGDPGLGKSMLTCDIAARVTTGEPWPCSSEQREPADVIMLSAEDDPEDTVVPRLIAAGADRTRVSFVSGIAEPSEDGTRKVWLSLDRHIPQLAQVLRERFGRVRLIIIDPLSAFLGRDTDSHNEGDVRSVLAGIAELAAEHRCAVLAVRHLRKSESVSAQSKIIGSIAFTAAARAVYIVARDPEDEHQRLLLCAKNNLAPDNAGYSYCIKVDDEGIPFIGWSGERETRTADEVLGASTDRSHAVDGAETWLLDTLSNGPVSSRDMRERAQSAGHSWRTVERARQKVGGIKIERDLIAGQGSTGPWQWRLVTPPRATPPGPHLNGGGLGGDRDGNGV